MKHYTRVKRFEVDIELSLLKSYALDKRHNEHSRAQADEMHKVFSALLKQYDDAVNELDSIQYCLKKINDFTKED